MATITTDAIGEEDYTTSRFGEEGATTDAIGEEDGTTYRTGEEGETTHAIGEEDDGSASDTAGSPFGSF